MKPYIEKRFPLKMDLQMFADDPPPADPPADPPKDKTFTQAELDTHVQQRVARAEKAAQKTLAVSLGFESVEAMQTALKPKEKPKDKDEPVDVEALVEEKLKAREKDQNDKTFKRLITAEVRVLASELGFADWEDALALADMKDVKEDEKGSITGVKEALEELAKKKPHLVKAKQGSKFGADVPNSQEQKKAHLETIKKQAQSRGNETVAAANDPWKRQ